MQARVVRGAGADELLDDPRFVAEWTDLWRACPWSTAFQRPDFALAWYRCYRSWFAPVLILSRDVEDGLEGLFPLAVERSRGRVVAAGAWQAEYQVWMSRSERGDDFARAAIDAVSREYPSVSLQLRYLPPGTPLEWTRRGYGRSRYRLQAHRRPNLSFGDGGDIEAALRKGSNRSRLRRLEKHGPIELRRLRSAAELDAVFDEIIDFHDSRNLALRGGKGFRGDPHKRPFYVAMADAPGLLHATVLQVGDRIAAAHLGTVGRDDVQLGIIVHNPWFARHSPGKFLLYLLARLLRAEGHERLDLTPGGDAYKQRFANSWDEVHTLDVLPASHRARAVDRARTAVRRARRAVQAVRRVGPPAGGVVNRADRRMRRYTIDPRRTSGGSEDAAGIDQVRRDRLADLLAYRPEPAGPSAQDFAAAVLQRIEKGEHSFYTRVVDGRLEHAACLGGPAAAPEVSRPRGAAVVQDVYAAADAAPRGLEVLLRALLADAARESAACVVAVVPAANATVRQALEAVGFVAETAPMPTGAAPSGP